MAQDSSSTSMEGGSQGPPSPTNNNMDAKSYMMNVDSHLSTKTHDYEMSESVEKGNVGI
jgi:hypothetical protein